MYDETRELVDALRVTPETLAGLLRDVTPERARAARGGDEDWSVVEVMCHMRDTEEQALGRMRALRDMPDPVVGGFDQMALARERSYATDDLHAALAAFAEHRAAHVAELAALAPEQWDRVGRHTKVGDVTIRNHTLHIVWHDANHMAQIARQLGNDT